MPFQFQAKPYSSLDPISETEIPRPRIGPTVLADGRHGTEYQFAIYRGESRVGGVGFDGWDETTQDEGRSVHCFVFDLNPYLRAPYSGETLGEFIIYKLMPPYQDAADRLISELRKDALLAAGAECLAAVGYLGVAVRDPTVVPVVRDLLAELLAVVPGAAGGERDAD